MTHHRRHVAAAAASAADDDDDDHSPVTFDTDKLSYEIFSILESKFLFGIDDSIPPPSSMKTQRGKVRILSIDASLMRGLLPSIALSHLETSLQSITSNPSARISDFFDLAAGSSIGGLLTSLLFSPTPSPAHSTSHFLSHYGNNFIKPKSSSFLSCFRPHTETLERVLKDAFSPGLTLKDTVKPVLIPCYDLNTAAPFLFSRADGVESESFDFRLWEVCKATMAEPSSPSSPVTVTSVNGVTTCVGVDGGITMSNPTAAAITHVLHNKQEFPFVRGVEDLIVLSLGCGVVSERSNWSRIAADGSAELVDRVVAHAFGQCGSNNNYVRIQANDSTMSKCGADADWDPSPKNVKVLLGAADEMLKQKNVESVLFGGKRIGEQTNMEKLDWLAGELVLEHQRRSCRIAPTVAFKQPPPKPSN